MFTSSSKLMRMLGGRNKQDEAREVIFKEAINEVRALVEFATSVEYTQFQLEDQRTVNDLKKFVRSREVQHKEIHDLLPVGVIISLMHPKYSANIDLNHAVDLVKQYVGQSVYLIHIINDSEKSMSELVKYRDICIRLARSGIRYCEVVDAINTMSAYLTNHPVAENRHAKFVHDCLLSATREYKRLNK